MMDACMTSDRNQRNVSRDQKGKPAIKVLPRLVVASIMMLLVMFALTSDTGKNLLELFGKDVIVGFVQQVGYWGLLLIVAMMAAAVVFSPLPSAPIAVAAGAAYGHVWGTISVVIGASLGAVIAFLLARWLGRDFVRRWTVLPICRSFQPSQRTLMLTVIAARLIPFVSFDAVSYAAGLTKLSLFKFSVATVLGLIPMSFFLAHIGDQWVEAEGNELLGWVLVAGAVTLLPAAGYAWKRLWDRETSHST
jgi:uncharacterized membrane protein YdjX (TVP38/TMEM64 family)